MEKDNQPPALISENDSKICEKLGKFIMEKADWSRLSTKELMELFKLLMWYNTLSKKLEDNVIEPKALINTKKPKQDTTPKKKSTRK